MIAQHGCQPADRVSLRRQPDGACLFDCVSNNSVRMVFLFSRGAPQETSLRARTNDTGPRSETKHLAPDGKEQLDAAQSSLLSDAWSVLTEIPYATQPCSRGAVLAAPRGS